MAATAVCKAIKKKYPNDQLIVITGYPEVFLCTQGIKVFNFNDLRYFYEQFIDGKEIKVMAHNPYLETAFVKKEGHLIKVWCEMFGIPFEGELLGVTINEREQTYYTNIFGNPGKPIMVVQTNGGAANQPINYSWTRKLNW